MVKITFQKGDDITNVDAPVGISILELAHSNGVELEGACEGSLACSTCHVVMQEEYYNKLEAPSDDEDDMLDMAFGLTTTSRLGCQIQVTEDLEGAIFTIPSKTRNIKS